MTFKQFWVQRTWTWTSWWFLNKSSWLTKQSKLTKEWLTQSDPFTSTICRMCLVIWSKSTSCTLTSSLRRCLTPSRVRTSLSNQWKLWGGISWDWSKLTLTKRTTLKSSVSTSSQLWKLWLRTTSKETLRREIRRFCFCFQLCWKRWGSRFQDFFSRSCMGWCSQLWRWSKTTQFSILNSDKDSLSWCRTSSSTAQPAISN